MNTAVMDKDSRGSTERFVHVNLNGQAAEQTRPAYADNVCQTEGNILVLEVISVTRRDNKGIRGSVRKSMRVCK